MTRHIPHAAAGPAAPSCSTFPRRLPVAVVLAVAAAVPLRAAEPKGVPPPHKGRAIVARTAGALLLVGGGNIPNTVRDRFLELAGGRKARLVVIPTASAGIDRGGVSSSYLFWQNQNVSSVDLLHTRDRGRSDDPDFVRPLETATGVWLGGGDQSRLTQTYLNTAVQRELWKVLERGGVVGGTSAGASVASKLMITGGTTQATLGEGMGFVPGMIIDQHFSNRNRMGRLLGVVGQNPDYAGLGIDEQTAAVFQGDSLSVVGNADVWVCLTPTARESASVQRLRPGDRLDLSSLGQTVTARAKSRAERGTASASGAGREGTSGAGREGGRKK